jgi:hypothetical protein
MELKFRGQKITDNQWLYFDLKQYCENDDEETNPFLEYILKNVTQNTGLKDKNNIDVYEGDVLRKGNNHKHIVNYKNGCFCPDVNMHLVEIIGNIFDNPELLL